MGIGKPISSNNVSYAGNGSTAGPPNSRFASPVRRITGKMNAIPIADFPAPFTRRVPNLTLHCGAHAVQIEQVSAVKMPEPTASWQPIPHDHLIRQVETTL